MNDVSQQNNLAVRTTQGAIWSTIERFSTQGINLLVGVVLARILAPELFGLIAMLTIFMSLSSLFVDSGFGKALIQKQNKTEVDYSSVFFFNIFIGLIGYIFLFISAPFIADFYGIPLLSKLLRYLGLTVIINSFIVVHNAILIEKLNFKFLAKVNLLSVLISGSCSIWYAYNGGGIWALVVKSLLQSVITTLLLLFFIVGVPNWSFLFAY